MEDMSYTIKFHLFRLHFFLLIFYAYMWIDLKHLFSLLLTLTWYYLFSVILTLTRVLFAVDVTRT